MNYYQVLEVDNLSTDLEINNAFQYLALKLNKLLQDDESIEEQFVVLAEAYEVLKDPIKRAIYDQYGATALKIGIPGCKGFIEPFIYHGDFLRTFEEFFGTQNPYVDLVDFYMMPLPFKDTLPTGKKQPSIIQPLYLTLDEIYCGGVKKVKIKRKAFLGDDQTEMMERILDVPVPPGVLEGTKITYKNMGDSEPGTLPGDLVLVVTSLPHHVFKRDGPNLKLVAQVSLEEAKEGTSVIVNTLDSRMFLVTIHDKITSAYRKVVEGEGMPFYENPTQNGDLVIKFDVCV